MSLAGPASGFLAMAVASLVAGLSGGAAGAAPRQTECTPTTSEVGGPNDRTPPLRAKIGTGHVLTGVVLSPTCQPVAGARVSFRQANRKGAYLAAGRGSVIADRSGRFRFEGPMPPKYETNPAHIHVKVEAKGFQTLYTRYEPKGMRRGSIQLVLTPSAP